MAAASLAGCNGESDDKSKQATAVQGSSPAEQTELAKSNAYIIAANESSGMFAKALASYQEAVSPKLSGNRPLETYDVVSVQQVTKIRSRLEAASAMDGSIAELDPAASDYAAAIAAFDPVNNGLANYAQSKGFLTDGGAKARAEDRAFVASLTKVVDAEKVFFDRIEARDKRLMRAAYDNAPEGSVARYRAGIVLRGKAAMKDVVTVFTDPADVATRQAFAQNLDEMAKMVENWDRAVRAEKPEGCPALQGSFNSVIANGRKAVQSAEKGRFDPASGTPSSSLQYEFNGLQRDFSMMIFQLNQPFSC
ncbi:DUF3829 domain-containing protein [Agrobacterium cavarae]|uniref:DUF3829 domain-containing protein n=1 Tax=Agrobacterium cavarae TaxID=2528239 RepID=UPI003EE55AB5